MIPLYKLEKLPRIQRLRKIAKFFSFADNRFSSALKKEIKIFTSAELGFFADASSLLSLDIDFSSDAKAAFAEAAGILKTVYQNTAQDKSMNEGDIALFHRAINSVKHILLLETGRDQADWDLTDSGGRLDFQKRQVIDGMCIYMEDIRSPFNIGAMFRTAESFGVEKIILSPFCADPNHARAKRTAMGCIDIVPWERKDLFPVFDSPDTAGKFDENYSSDSGGQSLYSKLPVFALETGGIPLDEFPFPRRGLLIAGSEELGVSPRALEAADKSLGRVSIPCYGTKASLNVSVAFGIALQCWRQAMSENSQRNCSALSS